MTDYNAKGQSFLAEAEKKRSSFGFLSFFFKSVSKLDEASELYTKAANTFKMGKHWTNAGHAFIEAAKLQLECSSKHNAAMRYIEAANCFRKNNYAAAVECYLKAIEIYIDMGRFIIAAKQHVVIAEIYEEDNSQLDLAIAHYEQAADYFKGDESRGSANKYLTRVAHHYAIKEEYEKAISYFEKIGDESLKSNLLKYSAKDYFFKACICHMCIDCINARHALKKYEELAPAFVDSRESKLVRALAVAMEEKNVDLFTDVLKKYDSISRLDEWQTTLFLRAKKCIINSDIPDLC